MKPKILIAVLILLGTLCYTYYYWQSHQSGVIDSYESCVAANGSRIQESYPATCVTKSGARFIQPIAAPTPDPAMATLISSLGHQPQTWTGGTLTATTLAPDLIEIDIEHPEKGPDEGQTQYWTNNRTGKWQLLGSFEHGQEGWGHCEDWEKLKVAKRMSCLRWDNNQGWVESVVNY